MKASTFNFRKLAASRFTVDAVMGSTNAGRVPGWTAQLMARALVLIGVSKFDDSILEAAAHGDS
jgi:hypothetical protein